MELVKRVAKEIDPRIWTLTTAACGLGGLVLVVQRIRCHWNAKRKIERAKERRAESLQRAEQAVSRYKDASPNMDSSLILSLSLSELTEQLHEGSLSPEDVFHSYMEKALHVNKALNCCTGALMESLDQLETIGSSKDGLLYGVPVSIKDNFGYKNHDSSCGLIKHLEQPAEKDCVIVEVLKRQGAIPFVKTNIPQGLMNYDCSNPIYGQSVNPHNLQKTTGGSSGGEGGLIGGGGSILGIGTDIGGSIRIPSSFCGICGLKATGGRLSSRGIASGLPGQKSLCASAGPMAQDVDSLALCMQALLCDHMFSLDPTVPPLPFNMKIYQSSEPLRIGYYLNDDCTEPSPSMARAITEVKALLERAGHTLVPYCPPRVGQVINGLAKSLFPDGGSPLLDNLKGGPVDQNVASQVFFYRLSNTMKKILSLIIRPLFPRMADTFNALCGVRSIPNLWKIHTSLEDYIHEAIAEWRRCNIDVLLCPVIGPAYNLHYCGKVSSVLSFTTIYNVLNFPAGVVTVSTVTAEDEEKLKHYKGNYQDPWDKLFKEAVTGGEGLPVGVQCVALPWQDELCLRFMKEVEQLVKQKRR
ncbi:vitamin D3 hydroxylase-associated protein-like [Genypterus blacodes]|uniref:vitamin D3 hydroxylase-associated protein-like n=1 Tax=Genypterus blacodes TaxID=154954 RepID=UPI003F7639ED